MGPTSDTDYDRNGALSSCNCFSTKVTFAALLRFDGAEQGSTREVADARAGAVATLKRGHCRVGDKDVGQDADSEAKRRELLSSPGKLRVRGLGLAGRAFATVPLWPAEV
jgi:hypothetical protein